MAKLDELLKQKEKAAKELAAIEAKIQTAEALKAKSSELKADLARTLTHLLAIDEIPSWIDIEAVKAKDGVFNFYRALKVKKS